MIGESMSAGEMQDRAELKYESAWVRVVMLFGSIINGGSASWRLGGEIV